MSIENIQEAYNIYFSSAFSVLEIFNNHFGEENVDTNIPKFEDTEYNVNITEQDTFNAVYGIIERRIGEKYKAWFEFEIKENPKGNGFDYFNLSNCDGKILVTGNSGVSLAVGVNHYLKYYCKVNICQVGDQAKMPTDIILLDKEIFKETKHKKNQK